MVMVVGQVVSLLKLRIGVAIAASAMAGMAATQGPALSAGEIVTFALAVLGGAGAAGAFNHYYERETDRRMARTRRRPFASGAFRESDWWLVSFGALLVASLLLAAISGGMLAALYVFLGAFVYGIVYTVWLKHRTVWNIVVGGLAGSFAVLAGAAAVNPAPQAAPLLLAVVLFLWTPPHFWSLAAARSEDYVSAGVPMLPNVAPTRTWTLAILLHTVILALLSLAPLGFGFGPIYGIAAASGGAYFAWRSWQLYRQPTPAAAMANFKASLLQLSLLILGVVADSAMG
ncbi:MAG: protoheme IX farnesyltransferase [Bradyrhizobiaceae bacterium]|nr:protoheme IX farnesyltransferase [Bradyrhizobiaceae bacterium]